MAAPNWGGKNANTAPRAKTCYYKGIKFKSNLEGKTAEALDNLGIRWEYERQVVRGSHYGGGQYTPDFYLPNENIYLEVAWQWDEEHQNDARWFFKDLNIWDFTLNDECAFYDSNGQEGNTPKNAPTFAYIAGSEPFEGQEKQEEGRIYAIANDGCVWDSYSRLVQCPSCGRWSLVDVDGSGCYCPCHFCGHTEPDNNGLYYSKEGGNLFVMGNVRHFKPAPRRGLYGYR